MGANRVRYGFSLFDKQRAVHTPSGHAKARLCLAISKPERELTQIL